MSTTGWTPERLRAGLRSRHTPWLLSLLAMLLCLPALRLGRVLDDDFHRLALTRPDLPMLSRSPAELFVFVEGDESANRMAVTFGMAPWWSHEKLRLAFFRPLAGLTHWLDYELWPERPSLMHLHSLVWMGAVVVAAAVFYRRVIGPTWVAGLAGLLFAVDDAHGLPAVWIANRNALLGMFFGLLALIAHDRWRRDGWWIGALCAPAAFLLALLSKESAVAVGAYLFAYALFLDRGTWVGRLASLTPGALVGVLWWIAYRHFDYGTIGSGWYVDPGADPSAFAQAIATRAPNLLAWQWLIPSDLNWSLSPHTAHVLWVATMFLLVAIAAALVPLLKRDPLARFWGSGMLLSVLPICTAYPADRLLMFVGLGGMGLLAQFVAFVVRDVQKPYVRLRLPVRVLCVGLVVIHLIIAPLHLARTARSFKDFGSSIVRAAASLPSEPATRFQTVLIVGTPTYASFVYSVLTRLAHDEPYLNPTVVLGSSTRPIQIHRPDAGTLLVRPEGGFLASAGGPDPGSEMEQLLFDQRRAALTLDRLHRDHAPMTIGQQIRLVSTTVEITSVTDDGRPAEVAFHFAIDLENPLFRWMRWQDGAFAPFVLPAIGETVTLPAATVPF